MVFEVSVRVLHLCSGELEDVDSTNELRTDVAIGATLPCCRVELLHSELRIRTARDAQETDYDEELVRKQPTRTRHKGCDNFRISSNMAYTLAPEIPAAGFSFENCMRNANYAKAGFQTPKVVKTGTTIVGIIFKDGVILGADTRATEDTIVSDKNCSKIHFLAKNMYCCGAGTAADTEMTTQMIASQLELHRLNTGRIVPVVTANTLLKQMLFRYQGHIGAALVLGGVDNSGPHLYCIYPHGSTDKIPYATMGSGSLAAMAVFESQWKPDMSEEDGKLLVRNAVAAGIFNDLGSGSNVDLCVIRKEKVDYLRTYEEANVKGKRQASYRYEKGATTVLTTKVIPIIGDGVPGPTNEPMDTSS